MKKKLKKRYGYRLFKLFVRFFVNHLLFRKHYILGKENLPAMGEPMILPANHSIRLLSATSKRMK